MTDTDAANTHFNRVHCIGARKAGSTKHLPIVAKAVNSKTQSFIMERTRELKGTSFSLSDQFPP